VERKEQRLSLIMIIFAKSVKRRLSMKKCKKCGCDFPNNEIYKKGCSFCESEKEFCKRELGKLKNISLKNSKETIKENKNG
jgi:hypothetical protein